MANDLAIRTADLGKKFAIYSSPFDRVKEALSFGRKSCHLDFWALRHVSIEIEKGRCVGVVGSNGVGKTTLLRLLLGLTRPSEGAIERNGIVHGLIDLGSGFHPEMSGRENAHTECALLGMGKREISAKVEEIIDFAELSDFVDQPVRTYSTGMLMRLGFAVATCLRPDILLVDEVLGVGDQYFQCKCLGKIKEFKNEGGTIIFVSHNPWQVGRICERAIWINAGQVERDGIVELVLDEYESYEREKQKRDRLAQLALAGSQDESVLGGEAARSCTDDRRDAAVIDRVELLDPERSAKTVFHTSDTLVVSATVQILKPIDSLQIGVAIYRNDGILCFGTSTLLDNVAIPTFVGRRGFDLIFEAISLLPGTYEVAVALIDEEGICFYDLDDRRVKFTIANKLDRADSAYPGVRRGHFGVSLLNRRWELQEPS